MVSRLHDAGIEVILDVVYNHTAEGNERGATLSFKGIDNASYYRLAAGPTRKLLHQRHRHREHAQPVASARAADGHQLACATGCRKCISTGFRFDLGTILGARAVRFRRGRRVPQFVPAGSGAVIGQADHRAVGLRSRRLSGGQVPARLGRVERPLSAIRYDASGRGMTGKLPDLATRITASADLFNRRGRKPWASVNFATAHDGFTLNERGQLQRQAQRGERRRQQGRPQRQSQLEPRRRGTDRRSRPSARYASDRSSNMLAMLLLSQGTPMIARGRRVRPAPRAATTTPIARTTRSAGSRLAVVATIEALTPNS